MKRVSNPLSHVNSAMDTIKQKKSWEAIITNIDTVQDDWLQRLQPLDDVNTRLKPNRINEARKNERRNKYRDTTEDISEQADEIQTKQDKSDASE